MMKASIDLLARNLADLKSHKLTLMNDLNARVSDAKLAAKRVEVAEKKFAENEAQIADFEHGLTLLRNSEGIVDYSKGASRQ